MNYYLKKNLLIFALLGIIYYYDLKYILSILFNSLTIVVTIFATLSKLYIQSFYTVISSLFSIFYPKFWSIVTLISLCCLVKEIANILFEIANFLVKISNNLSALLIQSTIILQLLRNQNTVLLKIGELNRLLVEVSIHGQNVV
jgi:hypothetical protein